MLSSCYCSCWSPVRAPCSISEEIVLDKQSAQDFKSEHRICPVSLYSPTIYSPTSEQTVSILYTGSIEPDISDSRSCAGDDDVVSVHKQDEIMDKLVEVIEARRGHSASGSSSTELGSSDSRSFAGDDDVSPVELGDTVIKKIQQQ